MGLHLVASMGDEQSDRLLGVGILGAAVIAKKVVRGIKVSTAPLGKSAFTTSWLRWICELLTITICSF